MRTLNTGALVRGGCAVAMLSMCVMAACASGTTAAAPDGMRTTGDTLLEGVFHWTTLNEQPVPVEFPSGSGARLEADTLELRGLSEAIRSGDPSDDP